GDQGFAAKAQFPATSQFVVAVGGTSLTKSSSSRGWAEGTWSGAGSGCSTMITKPSYEVDTTCSKRMEADVSAVADPNTGVAVFDSGNGGWQVFGGTSASAPIVAATYTLLNLSKNDPSFGYKNQSAYFDVTSGSNGSCSAKSQCTA